MVHATNLAPLDVARVEIDSPTVRVVDQGESIKLTCTVEGKFFLKFFLKFTEIYFLIYYCFLQ